MIKNIPDKLYLQIGEEVEETDFNELDHENMSWSIEKIFPNDIEYTICIACNNYDKLVETLKGFVNEQEQQQKAYFELSGDIIELDENILKAKQLLQSLENN